MRNPLQEQLLKAGLVKKGKVAQVVREQVKQRHGKVPQAPAAGVDARQLQLERAERDRALAAERNAQAHERELRAQARQLIAAHQVKPGGAVDYRFQDGPRITSLLVDETQRGLLASGALLVVRLDGGYALLPRGALDKLRARDPGSIVVDHGSSAAPAATPGADDDAYYARFEVPDDLIW